jgi:RNA polymerase sigma-70 factor (ECF subfamily)
LITEQIGSKEIPMTERSNEQWLSELQAGSEIQAVALEDLRGRLQRSIYYYLSQDRSDLRDLATTELTRMAEDLAQDATLRVIDNLHNFRGESRFTTWANKIAVRLAISDLRRVRYRDFSLDKLTADGELLPQTSTATPNQPENNPEVVTERDNVMEQIEQAFREALTDRQYNALVAIALHGVPMDVVAEQLDTNRNALYKLIHDARKKLRNHL